MADRTGPIAFTSNLSINEWALVRRGGYEPLGQVMGSAVYHVGAQWHPRAGAGAIRRYDASYELEVVTEAYAHAQRLALSRLQKEATQLGAVGVVGVRLKRAGIEIAPGLLEFSTIGTAIRIAGIDLPPDPNAHAFLSSLSGEEFWLLRQGGHRPVGIAIGNCCYYQISTMRTAALNRGGRFSGGRDNAELIDYTQSVYEARALATGRMEAKALALGGEGVVGVALDFNVIPLEAEDDPSNGGDDNGKRLDMLYHFTAIGTAVVAIASPGSSLRLRPIVSLG